MRTWDKEAVYDEQISPLVQRIIELCKEHEIPVVAQFQIAEDEDNGPLYCTTSIPIEGRASDHIVEMGRRMKPPPPVVIAETHETMPDGSKRITSRLVSG